MTYKKNSLRDKDKNKNKNKPDHEDCLKKVEEYEQNWKRAVADYQNLKRRSEEDRLRIVKYANSELLSELLPVLDNFESLLKHNSDEGLKITVKHFTDILKNIGLVEIEVLGLDFDPTLCEAVEMVPGEKNKVVEVLQKGYRYQDKLLRPAKVNVGMGK